MRCRPNLLLATVAVGSVGGFANKKDKKTLPDESAKGSRASHYEVGRLRLMPDVQTADLVIAVQKGTGKAADATIGGGPVDNVPVIGERTDNGEDSSVRVGARQGTPPATAISGGRDEAS